jgi:hypothetical protein
MTTNIRIFLASSAELQEDRNEFKIFINCRNKDWVQKGVFLELVVWEDFLDTVSPTRLQDEYQRAIHECDLFVMLFFTKVGRYTEEAFETAFGPFQATRKPFLFTCFKNAPNTAPRADLQTLWAFQDKLKSLGHFQTEYRNAAELKLHFSEQLDQLAGNGFIEFPPTTDTPDTTAVVVGSGHQATLTGDGAIAQALLGATALGAGSVHVGGRNTGTINVGTQIGGDLVHGDKVLGDRIGRQVHTSGGNYFGGNVDTGGGHFAGRDQAITSAVSARELEALFAPMLAVLAQAAPAARQAEAAQQVQELKAEVARGQQADDSRIGRLIDSLAAMAPAAVASVLSTFATPILGGIAGPVTKFVLDRLKGN